MSEVVVASPDSDAEPVAGLLSDDEAQRTGRYADFKSCRDPSRAAVRVSMKPLACVVGDLSLVRALGRDGIPVAVATSDPASKIKRSRYWDRFISVVPREGIEPPTPASSGLRSTTELPRHCH